MYLYRIYETFLNLPTGLQTVLLFLLFMYILHLADLFVFKQRLKRDYGLQPRQSNHLLSPILAHTLHRDWAHLLGNSIPLAILGSIIALTNLSVFWIVTSSVMAIASLGTWILGSNGRHLGASGLVTGYFGYVVFDGFINQESQSALIGIVVGFFYFSLFSVVFRRRKGSSNVMHLFGFCGGLLAAWLKPFLLP
ncbi:MAG: rhomboid family intramembrane serine protease [Anaerolineae bacterium]|jgi:membrane associated rhomboid family serine protease|nr:rhomboid family intramembrane serine protease [Anaerolineae bacterium]